MFCEVNYINELLKSFIKPKPKFLRRGGDRGLNTIDIPAYSLFVMLQT